MKNKKLFRDGNKNNHILLTPIPPFAATEAVDDNDTAGALWSS